MATLITKYGSVEITMASISVAGVVDTAYIVAWGYKKRDTAIFFSQTEARYFAKFKAEML